MVYVIGHCIELLMTAENRCLPFKDFAERYREHFDKECRATDFGYQDIEKLLRAMPDTVQIIDDRWSQYVSSTLRRCPDRRLVQLTRSAALSGMDCPGVQFNGHFRESPNPYPNHVCSFETCLNI